MAEVWPVRQIQDRLLRRGYQRLAEVGGHQFCIEDVGIAFDEVNQAVYAHPGTQMVRLQRLGLLHKVAVGYYVVVPQERIGTDWRPSIEATAVGVATAALGGWLS